MIKNLLLTTFCLFATSSLVAEINYTDYGDGWVIEMNAAQDIDIDKDGVVDFQVNAYNDELGLVPIFAKGCFTPSEPYAKTSFGSWEMHLHQVGDIIGLNQGNMFDYIDDDRTSGYSITGGLADNWEHSKDVYIGFAVFGPGPSDVKNGWMRAAIDITNNTFILKEIAFHDATLIGQGSIVVGDTGLASSVNNLDEVLTSVSINPNPANEFLQISYDFESSQSLNISVFNTMGQQIERMPISYAGKNQRIKLFTSDWSEGLYLINFSTKEGTHTEKLLVSH